MTLLAFVWAPQEVSEEKFDKAIAPKLAEEGAASLREEVLLKKRRAELLAAHTNEAMEAQCGVLCSLMAVGPGGGEGKSGGSGVGEPHGWAAGAFWALGLCCYVVCMRCQGSARYLSCAVVRGFGSVQYLFLVAWAPLPPSGAARRHPGGQVPGGLPVRAAEHGGEAGAGRKHTGACVSGMQWARCERDVKAGQQAHPAEQSSPKG